MERLIRWLRTGETAEECWAEGDLVFWKLREPMLDWDLCDLCECKETERRGPESVVGVEAREVTEALVTAPDSSSSATGAAGVGSGLFFLANSELFLLKRDEVCPEGGNEACDMLSEIGMQGCHSGAGIRWWWELYSTLTTMIRGLEGYGPPISSS